jgi:hypothetical protein
MLRTLCALASDAISHYHNDTTPDQSIIIDCDCDSDDMCSGRDHHIIASSHHHRINASSHHHVEAVTAHGLLQAILRC